MKFPETNETLTKSHIIEWTYWDKQVKIETFPVKWNKNVLINIHGTFWSLKWWNNKYLDFASKLQENSISNVVLYESSRKDLPIDDKITDRYKQKQAKFVWKTFLDELEDARRVIIDSIKNSEDLYWVNSEELEITLNWNSLGWILAFYLASEFPQVKNISTVWTWLRLDIKDVPILDTFPNIKELESKLEWFKWKFLMNYWNEDDVFIPEAFSDFYKKVWSKEKSFVHLLWVDHTFWKVWWELSQKPYKEIFNNIDLLLSKDILVSWEWNLLKKTIKNIDEIKNIVDKTLIDKYMVDDNEELNFVW